MDRENHNFEIVASIIIFGNILGCITSVMFVKFNCTERMQNSAFVEYLADVIVLLVGYF